MKPFIRLLALCLVVLSALLLSGMYLLYSQQGLEWAYRLAAPWLPGELTIDRLDGRLVGPLTLRGVRYRTNATDLRMSEVALQWQPGALTEGRLQVDSLDIAGLHILHSRAPAAAITLPDIRLPVAVHIARATVRGLDYKEGGKDPAIALSEAAVTNADFTQDRLRIEQLTATAPHYRFTITGGVTPQKTYPTDIAVQWSADSGDYGMLAGQARVRGDSRQLTITHRLTAPVRAELQGTVTDPLHKFAWQAALTAPEFKIQALHSQWPPLTLGGEVRGSGDLQRFQAESELHSGYHGLRAEHRLAVSYEKDILTLSRCETRFVESGTRVALRGTLRLGQEPQAVLEGSWQELRWPLQGEPALRSKAGRFKAAGALAHYQIHADGDLAGNKLPVGTWSIDGAGTSEGLTITHADGRVLGGTLTADGKLAWQTQLHWDAAIRGSDLNPGMLWSGWPGRIAFTAHSSGAIIDGAAQLQLDLSHLQGELKSLPVDADGVLTVRGDRYDLAKLRIDSGGNRFTAAGTLQDTWDLHWQVIAADFNKLKIFLPTPPLPMGEGWGEGLKQQQFAETKPTSPPLPLGRAERGGRSRWGEGSKQQQLVETKPTSPPLPQGEGSQSLPGSAGRLRGSGLVSGPRSNPLLTASLAGQQLQIAGLHIGALDLVMAVDTQDQVPSTVEIEARDTVLGNLHLDGIRLRGDGTTQHHQAQLSVTAAPGTLAVTIDGRYRQQQWMGTIAGLDADTSAAGRWQLAAPAQAALDKGAAHLDELCLQQQSARLCAAARWIAKGGWQAQGMARAMPLDLIKDWLPSEAPLAGTLDADARVAGNPAGLITGKVDARLKAGVASPAASGKDEAALPIIYHEGQLIIALDEQALSARLQADLTQGGGMQGKLRVERSAIPAPLGGGQTTRDGVVTGELRGDIRDLSLLPALIPGVEHIQGHLISTIGIAGSWDKPRLSGELRLENGSAAIPALGVKPDEINLVARGNEQGNLRLDAQLRSQGGSLHLGGDVHYLKSHGLNIEAQLTGDNAEIVNTPEFHIRASPNVHLSLQGRRIDLTGEIMIPEANLRPRDVSGAVSASDDVIILSAEAPPAATTRWQIYSRLRLRLGDFIKFSGFGLKGLLGGDLTISDTPQQPTVASGELNINDGQYRAYGQKLSVDRGRLLFVGGPVDNPGLDIRAVRKVQEVTAGILVRGTIKAPQVQLFSEPAMAETDALSYLLIGQPISQATATEGQQLYGAALSLGLAGSGMLANQIGQRFGIDEVLVTSGGTFGGGALVIRHYLSPKLYISYGVGLMERFNVFLMRYQISRRWSLEAESGIQSGADAVYTLERK